MAMEMNRFGRIALAVHDDLPPTDEEWTRWIELCSERSGTDLRVMVETSGGGPDAKQRKQLADAVRGMDLRSAIMTESILVRGIVTAIAWLGLPLRAFDPNDLSSAANYLGMTHEELAKMSEALAVLRRRCFSGTAPKQAASR